MVLEVLGMSGLKLAAISVEIGNILIILGLLYLYIKSYREIKIGFTLGLILFASFLLLRSIYNIAFPTNDQLVSIHSLIGGLIEFAGLIVLLIITLKY